MPSASSTGTRAQAGDPGQKNEAPMACSAWIHNNRNRVERLWARLKEWRAAATRYKKTVRSFMGMLGLAAVFDSLRACPGTGAPTPRAGT
jgi:transposase